MAKTIPYNYTPYDHQVDVFRARQQGIRHIFTRWHRRSGKDKTYWNLMIREAAQRKGTYFYFWPELKQGREALWQGMDNDGFSFLDHIPSGLRAKEPNNQDMIVTLSNGSIIKVQGTDKFENRRGTNPVGLIYSEYAYQNPAVRRAMNPILKGNNGWEALNSTPNGKNHMYHLEESISGMLGDDTPLKHRWFKSVKTMDDTYRHDGSPIFTQDDYEYELLEEGMTEEFMQQEYYVSYVANAQGYFYLGYMNEAREAGRVGNFPWVPDIPVTTYWDIGLDATAIWFVQTVDGAPRIIDFYVSNNLGLDYYAAVLGQDHRKGYVYSMHKFPHDMNSKEWGNTHSRIETAERLLGSHRVDFVPKTNFADGIQASRIMLSQVQINETDHTAPGIDALENYQRKYDKGKQEFTGDHVHNWASHPADAFRYFSVDFELPKKQSRLAKKLKQFRRKQNMGNRWMAA